MTHSQPSGPGATGGLPGENADPDVVQFAPDEAASTVAGAGEAPLLNDGGPTGTLAQTDERLSDELTEGTDEDVDLTPAGVEEQLLEQPDRVDTTDPPSAP